MLRVDQDKPAYQDPCVGPDQLTLLNFKMRRGGYSVLYGVESLSGVLERGIGVEWSQILEWQKVLVFVHKIESSCVCVCVCVCVRACVRACVRVCVCPSVHPSYM